MEIEIVGYEKKAEVKFEDLAPGTVFETNSTAFETNSTAKLLKLRRGYAILSFSNGEDYFAVGDGSMVGPHYSVSKVLGKLVSIKIQPI